MATDRDLLRHALAVLAYRASRPLRDAPADFGAFSTGAGTWTALHLVAHLADLMEWAGTIARGAAKYRDSEPAGWDAEVRRFYAALAAFDAHLAGDAPVDGGCERLLAGPVADALTHVGQLAMMRRMAGGATAAESFYKADIRTGVVGIEQPEPVFAFRRPPV